MILFSYMLCVVCMFECVYLYIYLGIILICIAYFTLFNIPEDGHDHDDHSSDDEEAKTLGSSGAVVFSAGVVGPDGL